MAFVAVIRIDEQSRLSYTPLTEKEVPSRVMLYIYKGAIIS